jgi:processive 1,2-diacylglycerol beta-glucosyltransferase
VLRALLGTRSRSTQGPRRCGSQRQRRLAYYFVVREYINCTELRNPQYNAPVAGEDLKADILILSSAIGSGHMRASEAVVRGVALLDPERTCSIIDFPHEVSPDVEHLLRSAYLGSLKLWPAAYGRIYRSSESKTQPGSYRHVVERAGLKTLERLVESTRARALVAPHFYGAGVLGSYKERNPRAFAAVVLTDYVPHAIGVPPNLDLYVVADEAAAEVVVKLGVPEKKIHPTGIPIDPAFEDPAELGGVRRDLLKLEDDDLPVVLVMGGGLGGGDLERAVSLLLETSAAMHLVVLCGSNERSRERLEKLAAKEGYSATFLAFTDRVRDLMAGATALVTKPGGMSCTEALATGLPQVLYHPIPGQEEDNAAATARDGAGVVVKTADEIMGETLRILSSLDHRRRMVEAARAAHRPHSARAAAELILGGLS